MFIVPLSCLYMIVRKNFKRLCSKVSSPLRMVLRIRRIHSKCLSVGLQTTRPKDNLPQDNLSQRQLTPRQVDPHSGDNSSHSEDNSPQRQLAPKTTRPETTCPKDNLPQDKSIHIQETTRPILKTTPHSEDYLHHTHRATHPYN